MVRYYSTNRALKGGFKANVSFQEALFQGLAPDDGLFMPTTIPQLSSAQLEDLKGAPYYVVASVVLSQFLEGDISADLLETVSSSSFNFDVPIRTLDNQLSLLSLDRGPTASFKDFGARFMAKLMALLRTEGKEICILVATSGDTGAAVGNAFHGMEGTRVFILYPSAEVSEVQKRMMDGIGDNVRSLALEGKFDDCQELVKRAFVDPDLRALNLTSANSINIGRVLPQVVFYVYSFLATKGDGPIIFSVPSGNLGNSLGCEIARRMGLPVAKLILATNANDSVPRFLQTGRYTRIERSIDCMSNAMNVGNPSNLARFFDLYGGTIMRTGRICKTPNIEEMRENLFSISVSDRETVDTIRKAYTEFGIVIEPHAAVGLAALFRYIDQGNTGTAVALQTAHPGKYPELLEGIVGSRAVLEESVKANIFGAGREHRLEKSYAAFKQILIGE